MKATIVKSADLPRDIALMVFEMLNVDREGKHHVKVIGPNDDGYCVRHKIITDREPMDLVYPEGWYYAKGNFRNKHNTSKRSYSEIPMYNKEGIRWDNLGANYCTQE